MDLSIVIPVYDDAAALARLLDDLAPVLSLPAAVEVLVVDGGSRDDPAAVCRRWGVACLAASPGRGAQLATGIAASRGRIVWMLHADSRLPEDDWPGLFRDARGWGRCRLSFEPGSPGMAMVAFCMHWRSRLTGICTGDQGIWVERPLLSAAGGMPQQPLMEDIELSRRLKRRCRPRVLPLRLRTSPRRWQSGGLWRTIFRMWRFRLRYWAGVSPERLAEAYRRQGQDGEA